MNGTILSVIVTSYNYEKYIRDTLDSLLSQTNENFKIIVIDDGSKDGSVNVIRNYVKRRDDILFLQHKNGENKGLCESTKVALSYVDTEYVAFCESDDWWEEHHVEYLLHFIESNKEPDFLFNTTEVKNYSTYKGYEAYVENAISILKQHSGENIFSFEAEGNLLLPTFSSACVRTKFLQECDFHSQYPPYLDFWLWRQLCLKHNVYFVDNCITYWRKHNKSYDMVANKADLKDFLIASNNLILRRNSFPKYLTLNILKYFYSKENYLQKQKNLILKLIKTQSPK